MRKAYAFLIPLSALLPLAWWACSKPEEPLSPSLATTASCNVTMTYLGTKVLTVSPNSTNNNASWNVNNNGTSAVTLTGQTLSKSGTVTEVLPNVWAPFPYSLAAGSKIDADLRFSVGASGTGSVGMTVSSSCGSIVAPVHPVVIQAPATGIPYGLSALGPNENVANKAIWTGSSLTNQRMIDVMNNLRNAQNRTPRLKMWFNLTAGDEQAFMYDSINDRRFKLQAWKDSLDKHVKLNGSLKGDGTSFYNDSIVQGNFIGDGTLQGHIMLDDLAAFEPDPTQAEIDSMAAYSKRRFPTLLTAVRYRPVQLKGRAAACSTCPEGLKPYGVLDMGWAQYVPARGDPTQYRNDEIAAAKLMKVGMVIGINIRKGMPDGSPVPTASILDWGTIFLAPGASNSDYVCGFIMWDAAYVGLGNSTFNTLATKANNHVKSPCKFH
jgi:hypothetical protein